MQDPASFRSCRQPAKPPSAQLIAPNIPEKSPQFNEASLGGLEDRTVNPKAHIFGV